MLSSIRWLLARQREDGAWASNGAMWVGRELTDAGTTALALLVFYGAGYSHLSKDAYDGIPIGPCIRRAQKYLVRRQGRDGVIRAYGDRAGRDHDFAALALSEAYGLTGSQLLKEPAQNAVSVDRPKSALLVQSALLSGLAIDPGEALYDWLGSPAERLLASRVQGFDPGPFTLGPSTADDLAALRFDEEDMTRNWLPALAVFMIDGKDGAMWRKWGEYGIREVMRELDAGTCIRAPHGRPGQQLAQTVALTLSLELYYRYANTLGR